VCVNYMICIMVLCYCLFNWKMSVVNSCMCDQSNELAGWFYVAKPFYELYVLGMRVFGIECVPAEEQIRWVRHKCHLTM